MSATSPSLFERYDAVLCALPGALRRVYGQDLVSCAVYGSVGRRTQRFGSDIDLLIVARNLPDGRTRRVVQFEPAEDELAALLAACGGSDGPAVLSPVFKTPEEAEAGNLLFLDMVEDARVLVDEHGFFAARLDRLRRRMQELGSQRIWRGNAWHWVLKPDFRPGEVFEL